MQVVIGNETFNKQQLRALFQAICVEENTDITTAFATLALEDGVDIINDMALEPSQQGIGFDHNDVRQQAHNVVETSLSNFALDINSQIDLIPVQLTVKTVVTATAKIG